MLPTSEAWSSILCAVCRARYIRQSHDVVQDKFGHGEHRGKSVRDTIQDLETGTLKPQDWRLHLI